MNEQEIKKAIEIVNKCCYYSVDSAGHDVDKVRAHNVLISTAQSYLELKEKMECEMDDDSKKGAREISKSICQLFFIPCSKRIRRLNNVRPAAEEDNGFNNGSNG